MRSADLAGSALPGEQPCDRLTPVFGDQAARRAKASRDPHLVSQLLILIPPFPLKLIPVLILHPLTNVYRLAPF